MNEKDIFVGTVKVGRVITEKFFQDNGKGGVMDLEIEVDFTKSISSNYLLTKIKIVDCKGKGIENFQGVCNCPYKIALHHPLDERSSWRNKKGQRLSEFLSTLCSGTILRPSIAERNGGLTPYEQERVFTLRGIRQKIKTSA